MNALESLTVGVTKTLNRFVEPAVRAGIANPRLLGTGLVVLQTKGRKTGLTREVPLVAARIGSRVLVSTVRNDSQWFKNLAADDAPAVYLDGQPQRASVKAGKAGGVHVAVLELDR